MSFELEPLQIKPLTWVDTEGARGLTSGKGPLLQVTDAEMSAAFVAMLEVLQDADDTLTLQKLLLRMRMNGRLVKLRTLHRAIEFLSDHELLNNTSAPAWIQMLRKGAPPRLPVLQKLRGWMHKPAPVSYNPYDWEQLPVLRQLSKDARREMLAGARVRHFPKGFRLCRAGSRDRQLMIMLSGQAAVIKKEAGQARQVVAVLEKEAMFGETSHFLNQPRTADVMAMTDCAVLCIPAKDEKAELPAPQFQKLQTRLWFLQSLQRNPTFQEIPSEAFDALLLNGKLETFKPNQTIVREGEAADACYFLIQGHVRVLKRDKEINRLTSGSVIGEIALLQGAGGRTATAIADGPVTAIKYEWDEFWTVLSQHFVLGMALERLADKRLERDRQRSA